MIINTIPYTILTITLLIFTLKPQTTTSKNNLITSTCKTSSLDDPNINYNFCINSFNTSPSSHTANLTRLGLISINLTKHHSTRTRFMIKSLLGNGNGNVSRKTKVGLRDCLELYSTSVSTLFEVARDYRAKRLDDANVKISGVMDGADTCEQGFQDVGVFSPLSRQNNDTFQFAAIALSIIHFLPSY